MTKPALELSDLSIAPRKPERAVLAAADVVEPVEAAPVLVEKDTPQMLPRPTDKERREAAEARATAQEDVRYSLKNLKRSKQRNVKFFINIALDYELKMRLQRAASENDLKMTAVVKAALDYYLTENGY